MKTMKKVAAVLLAVMLMAPAAVNAAAPSALRQLSQDRKQLYLQYIQEKLSYQLQLQLMERH